MTTTYTSESARQRRSRRITAAVAIVAGFGTAAVGMGTAHADPVPELRCPDHYDIGHDGPVPFTVQLVNWTKGGTVHVSTFPGGLDIGDLKYVQIVGSPEPGAVTNVTVTVGEPVDTLWASERIGRGDASQMLVASCPIAEHFEH